MPIDVCESVGPLTTELKKAFEGFDPSMLEVRSPPAFLVLIIETIS